MAKRIIRVEVESDLHAAILSEATKLGISKGEVVRSSAQKFLAKVYDTSRDKGSKKKRRKRK